MVTAGTSLKLSDKSDRDIGTASRVLIVDDDPGFRDVVRRLVDAADGLEAVASVCSGEEALDSTAVLCPDLVLMDVVMPGLGGIEVARRIKQETPSVVVVLISTTHPDDLPQAASDCLADEIVWKAELRPALLDEIWQRHRP
jgi:DNA-binding NarL/FixJ family response regulator